MQRDRTALRESASAGKCPVALGLAGGLVVFIFTVVALSGAISDLRAASVSFTAIVAALTAGVSLTLVLLYNRVPRPAARAAGALAAFLAWMLGSLLISGASRQGLQFIMVQVAFVASLLIASTARIVVGARLDAVVARCVRFTASMLMGSAILGAAGVAQIGGTRPVAMVALIGMAWFLAEYRLGNRNSLWWSLAVLLGIAISLSRTALFAAFVLLVATLFLASGRRRAGNAILCVFLVASGYWAVTSWAPLHDRFVTGDVSLSVGGVNVNAEGRTKVWTVLWSEAQDEPLIGRGAGAASARSVSLNSGFDQPHNDYLRIFYDFGVVGVGMLAWFGVRSTRLLRSARKRSRSSIPALAAPNAELALLVMMTATNPLDYPFFMIPLGALIGLGLGSGLVARGSRQPASAAR